MRWWLPVALFVYAQPAGTFRNHAVEGLGFRSRCCRDRVAAAGRLAAAWAAPDAPGARRVWAAVALICLPGLAADLSSSTAA